MVVFRPIRSGLSLAYPGPSGCLDLIRVKSTSHRKGNDMILETRHSIPEILSRQPLFRTLTPAELERLATHAREYRLDRNELPLHKGETSPGLHVVIAGQMKMCLPSLAGTEKVVRMLGPGDIFGEEGVFLNKPCPMAIQAVRDSLMLVLARASLMEVMAVSYTHLTLPTIYSV